MCYQNWACLPLTMVAKMASILIGNHPQDIENKFKYSLKQYCNLPFLLVIAWSFRYGYGEAKNMPKGTSFSFAVHFDDHGDVPV